MARPTQTQSTRRNCPRHGFTLVELLVVITIIGVLMAMLIPVIGRVREYAHRVTCINNESQIALAMTVFATTKNRMPSTMSTFQDSSGTYTLGWAEGLMSQLDRADLAPGGTLLVSQLHSAKPYISLLVCPSDPTKVSPTTPSAPESYVADGGCENGTGNPVDWPANGAWSWTAGSNSQNVTITWEYIGKHDGISTTIALSENLNAPSYIVSGTAENQQAILWSPSSQTLFNQNTGTTISDATARPSSNHPGGAVVAFCDGSVRFISQTIAYNVYATLMTSYGAQASPPGTAFSSGNAYQALHLPVLDQSMIP